MNGMEPIEQVTYHQVLVCSCTGEVLEKLINSFIDLAADSALALDWGK